MTYPGEALPLIAVEFRTVSRSIGRTLGPRNSRHGRRRQHVCRRRRVAASETRSVRRRPPNGGRCRRDRSSVGLTFSIWVNLDGNSTGAASSAISVAGQQFPERGLLATSGGAFGGNIAACGQRKCSQNGVIVDRMEISSFATPKQAFETPDRTCPLRQPPSRRSNRPLA